MTSSGCNVIVAANPAVAPETASFVHSSRVVLFYFIVSKYEPTFYTYTIYRERVVRLSVYKFGELDTPTTEKERRERERERESEREMRRERSRPERKRTAGVPSQKCVVFFEIFFLVGLFYISRKPI